jgi:hypothetical protein
MKKQDVGNGLKSRGWIKINVYSLRAYQRGKKIYIIYQIGCGGFVFCEIIK